MVEIVEWGWHWCQKSSKEQQTIINLKKNSNKNYYIKDYKSTLIECNEKATKIYISL